MKLKIVSLVSLLVMGVMSVSLGQSARERLQDILAEVAKGPSAEKKIEILVNGSKDLRKLMPQEAIKLSYRAIKIAEENGVLQDIAYASYGAREINNGRYDDAIQSYEKALTYSQGEAKDASRANIYKSLGHSYFEIIDYDNSLASYQKSFSLYKKLKIDEQIAFTGNEIGKIYFNQKDYKKALNSFQEALKAVKRMGDEEDVKRLEENIRTCRERLGSNTASPNASDRIQALGFDDPFELIRDSLSDARRLILEQESKLEARYAELAGKDTTIAKSMKRIDVLQGFNESLAREKAQKERELVLYLIIAVGAAGTIAVIALLIFRNNRIKQKSNRDLADKNVEILEEKQKSDDLLLNILPEVVATELKATGKVKPKKYADATMLFTDFKGFTRLATSMSPEELISELNRCFEAFDDICARYRLEKIKTIGDAYMAVAGVPQVNPRHAYDTVRAALEMQAFMQEWKKEKVAQGKPFWELRIGVHSGSVIAGVIGKHKFVYDIWGDAVNIASRMESSGEAWEVNISQQTFDLVKDEFSCTARGKVPIKHKGPVEMYFVKGKK